MAVSFSDKFCAVMEATFGSCTYVAKKTACAVNSTAVSISEAYSQTRDAAFFMFRLMRGTAANVIRLAGSFII